jgi:feruloyl-CoA synthase
MDEAPAPSGIARPEVRVARSADGGWVYTAAEPAAAPARSVGALLAHWAATVPDRVLISDRAQDSDPWTTFSWRQAEQAALAIGQGLLARGLGPDRPLALLSGLGLDHVLLTLAAYVGGVPVVPVSEAYTTRSDDLANLRHVIERTSPGLVYARDPDGFGRGLELAARLGAETGVEADLAELATAPGAEVYEAAAALGPDDVAKVLFTSGSTDRPEGVLITHGMLCSQAGTLAQVWPFFRERPPVLVDWLPWYDGFGANHNFGLILGAGGTLYIDRGRPMPGAFETTIANIREVFPTVYFNVPAGFAQLIPRLEEDPELREAFFARLELICNAGAGLNRSLLSRMLALVDEHAPHVRVVRSWGATETSPVTMSAHSSTTGPGNLPLPVPGVAVKLAPVGEELELRVKGPNVTPGYLGDPERTAAAFDAEGYFRTRDAARLVDPDDPTAGFCFGGRIVDGPNLTG